MAKYREHEVTPFTGDVPHAQSWRMPTRELGRQNRIAAQLLGVGYGVAEVAELVSIPVAQLKIIMKSPLFRTEMEKAEDRFIRAHAEHVREKVYARAPRAVDVMDEIMEDPRHKDRLAAAKEFVGRVMPLKQEGGQKEPVVVINITSEKIDEHEAVLAEYEDVEEVPQ